MRLSLILTVLDSHEALRRQLLHLHPIMPPESELIVVDDGSEPPLEWEGWELIPRTFLLRTDDRRSWTQPSARNRGFKIACGDMLRFFDIDQILTPCLLDEAAAFEGDVLNWRREAGEIDELGRVMLSNQRPLQPHLNSLAISRKAFQAVHGYDERFCGEYGYFDIDLLQRLASAGFKTTTAQAPGMYWTDETIPPQHSLPRLRSDRNAAMLGIPRS